MSICGRVFAVAVCLVVAPPAHAQSPDERVLEIESGRPLRVALTETATVHRVGQPVKGTLTEPVYAYDRIVLPVGSEVTGHIAKLENPSRWTRWRAWTSGDFAPHRTIVLEFDSVIRDGRSIPIRTAVGPGTPRVTRQVARDASAEQPSGVTARAKQEAKARAKAAAAEAKQKVRDGIAALRQPGKRERIKEWLVDRLPYHPQVLRTGTTFNAALQQSVAFEAVTPRPSAPEGSLPAPSSILTARLATTLDSATTKRGMPLEAIISEPVFAEDGRLVLPEGTKLTGEITRAQPARRFHRNGQLRFLFERVELPQQESATLLASLHAIEVSQDDRVVLDDEGGAAVTNSKARFATPALAILAMRASLDQGEGRGFERGAVPGAPVRTTAASGRSGNPLGRGVGGLIGFGALGAALGQVSRPLGVAFAAVGVARSVYSNILGRGQDVHFDADTPIQVQLAPGPTTP
jgi:hypothetical protein